MSDTETKEKLVEAAVRLFAQGGEAAVSMRSLTKAVGVSLSVAYYHFADKERLLWEAFMATTKRLGEAVQVLPELTSAREMLKQRIRFQLDHGEEVVFLLRYFLSRKSRFQKADSGYVPERAYAHISAALERGRESGEFESADVVADAKVVTHAVNGFVLEYFPQAMSEVEKEELVERIFEFLLRALRRSDG